MTDRRALTFIHKGRLPRGGGIGAGVLKRSRIWVDRDGGKDDTIVTMEKKQS
jgi:hypothetical protein